MSLLTFLVFSRHTKTGGVAGVAFVGMAMVPWVSFTFRAGKYWPFGVMYAWRRCGPRGPYADSVHTRHVVVSSPLQSTAMSPPATPNIRMFYLGQHCNIESNAALFGNFHWHCDALQETLIVLVPHFTAWQNWYELTQHHSIWLRELLRGTNY